MTRLLAALLVSLTMGAPIAHAAWPDGEIRLGVLTDLSGIYSDATGTGSVAAVKLAVEDCLAGPCQGMTIEVLQADHQNKPDLSLIHI